MMSARPNGGMNRCARCLNSLDIISNTSLVMSEYLKKLHTLLTLFKKTFFTQCILRILRTAHICKIP